MTSRITLGGGRGGPPSGLDAANGTAGKKKSLKFWQIGGLFFLADELFGKFSESSVAKVKKKNSKTSASRENEYSEKFPEISRKFGW